MHGSLKCNCHGHKDIRYSDSHCQDEFWFMVRCWLLREPASLSHSFSVPSIGRLLTSFERSPIWKHTIGQGAFGEFGRCWWEVSCSFLHLWRGQEQSPHDWSGLPPKCTKPTKSIGNTTTTTQCAIFAIFWNIWLWDKYTVYFKPWKCWALLQSFLVDPSPKPKTYCKPLSVCQSALHIIPFWGRDFIRSDYHYLGARLLATPALWLIFHSSHQPVGIPQCVTVGVQLRLSRLAVTHLRCQFRAGTPATARSMEKRLVWTERVWMGGKAAFIRGDHWAVRIGVNGEDCHEVSQTGKSLKETGLLNIRSSKNKPIKGTLTLAGVTMRTDEDIHEFNKLWNKKYEKYKLLSTNCQKFARDLLEFLVGGSYQPPCPLPQASL